MAIKVHYRYRVYQGCDEATEKSKNWERKKSMGWSIWFCLGFATLFGSNAISQLITNTYDAEMFWPPFIFFIIVLPCVYSYVYQSKSVYLTCEELYLRSKRTELNSNEIDTRISSIVSKKRKDTKRALIKFSIIYFTIFIILVVFYCRYA